MNWTINQSELACTVKSTCLYPGDISYLQIFSEYHGMLFLIFIIIGFIALLVGFYLIIIEYGVPEKKPEEKKEFEPKSKGKRK